MNTERIVEVEKPKQRSRVWSNVVHVGTYTEGVDSTTKAHTNSDQLLEKKGEKQLVLL